MSRRNTLSVSLQFSIFALFGMIHVALLAQPTLTSTANLPQAGQSITVFTETPLGSSFDPGPGGANVNWDFSSLSSQNSAIKSYSNSNNSNFPDADLVSSFSGIQTFIGTGNDSYTYFGFTSNAAVVNYDDGQNQVEFPLTYQDTYSDTFSGFLNSFGQQFNREGTIEAEADGYGTLTTPEGTFNNVLRILIIRESEDYMNGNLVSNNLDSLYFWYNAHTGHPLMTCGKNYVDGNFSGSFANFMAASDIALGQRELTRELSFNCYPNPAKDQYVIEGKGAYIVEVFNITGQKELAITADETCHLKTGNWEGGPYMIVIRKDGKRMVQKLIVE